MTAFHNSRGNPKIWIQIAVTCFAAALKVSATQPREVSHSWIPTGNLNIARSNHTATLLPNGKVLVAGGYSGKFNRWTSLTNSSELYDPASGTWSVTGELIRPRVFHTATLLQNDKVLVTGGNTSTAYPFGNTASAELYDLQTGIWSATGYLTGDTNWHTATLLNNGKVLVAGGWGGVPLKKAELYDPETAADHQGKSVAQWNLDHDIRLKK